MTWKSNGFPLFAALALAILAVPAAGQMPTREDATVNAATSVLNEIMAVPARSIPGSLLKDAQALAIMPGTIKGGFVVGVRHGKGIVVVRDEQGNWQPPTFVTMTGGSIGWQVGVQATDVVLVFKTRKSVRGLMDGKFTIGADAAAAAGPIGRQAAAATDAQLGAEIYSYSRSRGLFAGVALDGSVLQVDAAANQAYYRTNPLIPAGQPAPLPASGVRLLQTIAGYTGGAPQALAGAGGVAGGLAAAPGGIPPQTAASVPAGVPIEQQLVQASAGLQAILDQQWQQFLALPSGFYDPQTPASSQALDASISRFETVARDPRYAALTQRIEFRQVLGLLQEYRSRISSAGSTPVTLPPPPAAGGAAESSEQG